MLVALAGKCAHEFNSDHALLMMLPLVTILLLCGVLMLPLTSARSGFGSTYCRHVVRIYSCMSLHAHAQVGTNKRGDDGCTGVDTGLRQHCTFHTVNKTPWVPHYFYYIQTSNNTPIMCTTSTNPPQVLAGSGARKHPSGAHHAAVYHCGRIWGWVHLAVDA